MSTPLLRRVAIVCSVLTASIGLYQFYPAALAAGARNWPFALFYSVFGIAGLALARALWTARRLIKPPAA